MQYCNLHIIFGFEKRKPGEGTAIGYKGLYSIPNKVTRCSSNFQQKSLFNNVMFEINFSKFSYYFHLFGILQQNKGNVLQLVDMYTRIIQDKVHEMGYDSSLE